MARQQQPVYAVRDNSDKPNIINVTDVSVIIDKSLMVIKNKIIPKKNSMNEII